MGGIKIKNLKDILEFLFLYPKDIEGLDLGIIKLYKYGYIYCVVQKYNGIEYALPFQVTNKGFVIYKMKPSLDIIKGNVVDLGYTYVVLSGILNKKSLKIQKLDENTNEGKYMKYFLWVLQIIKKNEEKIKKYDPFGIEEFDLENLSELLDVEII